jgi:hypothetical protein
MTAKLPSPTGDTLVSLPLSIVTLVRNQKSQEICKITNLCNINVKVGVYRSKSGLTQVTDYVSFIHAFHIFADGMN